MEGTDDRPTTEGPTTASRRARSRARKVRRHVVTLAGREVFSLRESLSWPSTWRLGGLRPLELGRRVFRQFFEDQVVDRAAQLAYFFFFSLFPLLLFLTALLGYLVEGNDQLRAELFDYLRRVLPNDDVRALVLDTFEEIRLSRGGGKLSFGLLLTLWLASNAMAALTTALNAAYDAIESRPWWKVRLLALLLTLIFAILGILGLSAVFYGAEVGSLLAESTGSTSPWLRGLVETLWSFGLWILVPILLVFAFDTIYNFAPDVRSCDRRWATVGAAFGVTLWLLGSFGFRLYLDYFDSYSKTYGSLGAVIALLTWFLLTGVALLVGGEINSEICKAEKES